MLDHKAVLTNLTTVELKQKLKEKSKIFSVMKIKPKKSFKEIMDSKKKSNGN